MLITYLTVYAMSCTDPSFTSLKISFALQTFPFYSSKYNYIFLQKMLIKGQHKIF